MSHTPVVAIVGLGLIGGSLALRLLHGGRAVWAHDLSPETLTAAEVHGITAYADLDEMLAQLPDESVVVLAVPLPQATGLMPRIATHTRDGVTVTDVVSVKQAMRDAARAAGLAHRFVGAHPMAGTAQSGFGAASADLLVDATWVVALDDDTSLDRWAQVCRLVLDSGGKVVPAESEWHDHATAWISHLPHVLAELLASNVEPRSLAGALAAGSYRDATRVASTRPELVEAMLTGNRRMLTEVLEGFLDQLEQAAVGVRAGEVTELVRRGHEHRTIWESRQRGTAVRTTVEIPLHGPDVRDQLRTVGAVGGFIVSHDRDAVTALT